MPTTTLWGETTSINTLEEIWNYLIDDETRKIGVYGVGGIGKTTLMTHLNNRLIKNKDKFNDVIWITTSKTSSVFMLQQQIACLINLDISKYDDELVRSGKLCVELSKRKRIVLILYDLCGVYCLNEVGILQPTVENGCKLVLTTRLLDVCRHMDCKLVKMKLLLETEALDLFLDRVSRDHLPISDLEKTKRLIVKECGNLLLTIVTIAGSLKGFDDHNVWKTTLVDLRESAKGT